MSETPESSGKVAEKPPSMLETPRSNIPTPASSVTGIPVSKMKPPKSLSGSMNSVSKIGRPCCSHATPKAGPPPRDNKSMSRESDDHSSINSGYTDLYQETVKRFTRSSLSPEMHRYSPSRRSLKSPSTSIRSDSNSYHGTVLTADTEHFIIGQKVWVGGIRPGQIAFIGETHFAPGDWAGVVLDEPHGKNDGCVAGKRYFQCEPKRGIFSRLTRLTLTPLPGAHTPTSPLSKHSPDRSRTVSPTSCSSYMRSPSKAGIAVGDRVIVSSGFGSRPGILRYLGETQFAPGNWCGVELDEDSGKNDGSVDGIRYFECKPKYGVFVPIAKVSLSPSSKKTRLSRTGSRESLNSINTINSVATTNTSRLRSNAQRKLPSIRPLAATPTKSQFSMQDLLREKQNHIERIMTERDLDREDAQNQALSFQKNIHELKSRISQLENQLNEERKKTEDLQFTVDEATFCGDELNAQTQVYKEKIHELERKIKELSSGAPSLQQTPAEESAAAITNANKEVQEKLQQLKNEFEAQKKAFEAKRAESRNEEKRLLENIKLLQTENTSLMQELVQKDELREKLTLSQSSLENAKTELELLKEETEKERLQAEHTHRGQLEVKEKLVENLSIELVDTRNRVAALESENASLGEECEILRAEYKSVGSSNIGFREQMQQKLAELNLEKSREVELRDKQCKQLEDSKQEIQSALESKLVEHAKLEQEHNTLKNELAKLKRDLEESQKVKADLSAKLETCEEDCKRIKIEQYNVMKELEETVKQFREQQTESNTVQEEFKEELKFLQEMIKVRDESICQENAQRQATARELKESKELVQELQTKLEATVAKSQEQSTMLEQQISGLKQEHEKLQLENLTLSSKSAASTQESEIKIVGLETLVKQLEQHKQEQEAELTRQREENSKQNSDLLEKDKELACVLEDLETATQQLDKVKLEQQNAVLKCAELQDNYDREEASKAQFQLEWSDLKRKHDSLSSKCESLAQQKETLEQNLLTSRQTSSETDLTVTSLKEELAAKSRELAELQHVSQAASLKHENQMEILAQQINSKDKELEELKLVVDKTKTELQQKLGELTLLEEKVTKQELAISDGLRLQQNLQIKYDKLLEQNESLQKDLLEARSSSTDSHAELVKLTQENASKQKALDDLLDKSNNERGMLEGQLQAAQQRIDSLCNQVEILTQELKTTSEETFKRSEELKQEQEQSAKRQLEVNDLTRKLESLSAKYDASEAQKDVSQKEVDEIRTAVADSHKEVLRLTEELALKQKAVEELKDSMTEERLQQQNKLQDLEQRLEASQHANEGLQQELKAVVEDKSAQTAEFETLRQTFTTKKKELKEYLAKSAAELQQVKDWYDGELKSLGESKQVLDEATTTLQQQIKALQEELLQVQIAAQKAEAGLLGQIENLTKENERLQQTLLEDSKREAQTIANLQQANQTLMKQKEDLEAACSLSTSASQQLQSLNSATVEKTTLLESQLRTLESALELTKAELEHKNKLAEEDRQRIEELKQLVEAVQISKGHIADTNAELSAALKVLTEEKAETAHIFEIFEMEADQNIENLVEKLNNLKQDLADAQVLLSSKDIALDKNKEAMEDLERLVQTEKCNAEAAAKQLEEYIHRLQEIESTAVARDAQLQYYQEVETQLNEYRQLVEEMSTTSEEKAKQLIELKAQLQHLMQENASFKSSHGEMSTLQAKYERMQLERTREVQLFEARIKALEAVHKVKENGAEGDTQHEGFDDSTAQINFLHSIIADMQKKNDTLKARIDTLEKMPTDFTQPNAFADIAKRKPAPRMFCDICDEFDKHETEDCPVQGSDDVEEPHTSASNDPNSKKERKIPEPRKYCESCEVFGHEATECMDDECY